MSRYIPVDQQKLLWLRSGGRCAFPGCRVATDLEQTDADSATVIGEQAHIFAHSINGPRPNPGDLTESPDEYENRIILCPTHHRTVDKQENTYSAQSLTQWKRDLERWVASSLAREEFSSAELESIVIRLASNDSTPPSSDFRLIPIDQKIQANELSRSVTALITMGLPRAPEVSAHVGDLAKFDTHFPERLLAPLLLRYVELREMGHNGNVIFDDLRDMISGHSRDFAYQAAALAVTVYFFHTCDLFEKS